MDNTVFTLEALALYRDANRREGAPKQDLNWQAAIDFVLANPGWRLSIQTHKLLGLR